jgi:hypothetical protein
MILGSEVILIELRQVCDVHITHYVFPMELRLCPEIRLDRYTFFGNQSLTFASNLSALICVRKRISFRK